VLEERAEEVALEEWGDMSEADAFGFDEDDADEEEEP
jgi:hypothetical protein